MTTGERPRPGPGTPTPSHAAETAEGRTLLVERRGSALPIAEASASGGASGGAARRRRGPGRLARAKRSTRRALRSTKGRWALGIGIGAVILVLGLFLSGFASSPSPLADEKSGGAAPGELQSLGPTVSPSATASGDATNGNAKAAEIKKALQDKFNNPLNNLHGPGYHTVTISARSSKVMPIVGYLVPTGTDAYGSRNKSGSFSITQQAYGKGYLAAVFVQTDGSGATITCTITVDGKVTNTASTTGRYGRQICVG